MKHHDIYYASKAEKDLLNPTRGDGQKAMLVSAGIVASLVLVGCGLKKCKAAL